MFLAGSGGGWPDLVVVMLMEYFVGKCFILKIWVFGSFTNLNNKTRAHLPTYFIIKKWTLVAHSMESHIRTFAHDCFWKACYFLHHLGKA